MFKLREDLVNKYEFVTLAALRAGQLLAGSKPRVAPLGRKLTIIAQEEVSLGLVDSWDGNYASPEATDVIELKAE